MGRIRKQIHLAGLLELIGKRMHGVRRAGQDCSQCLPVRIYQREPVDGSSNWIPALGRGPTVSEACEGVLQALLYQLSTEYDLVFPENSKLPSQARGLTVDYPN